MERNRLEPALRVLVVGATGAVGRRLVPQLVAAGHDVVGTTTSPEKEAALREAGAEPAVLDLLDADAVGTAVEAAAPEAIVHVATALSAYTSPKRMDKGFARTNELRTTGTYLLLLAAQKAGVRRFVAQSFAGWPFAREGTLLKTEEDPLDPDPPAAARETLDAIRWLEEEVPAAEGLEGLVLRYGSLYGPGTSICEGSVFLDIIGRRRFPVMGGGEGIWSFVHVDDAASATVAALEQGAPGIYNVVDDEPAPVKQWLPALAETIGAPEPRQVPAFMGRIAMGEQGLSMMTRSRGASNAKAKKELGWTPRYPSWRTGFAEGL